MVPLHRHQIAWLGETGWRSVLDRDWDPTERDCLDHWATRQLPLVVTRQASPASEDSISLGLPTPGRWGRRRLALTVARSSVLYFDEFPLAERLISLLPASARPAWLTLVADLKLLNANARVYGSYGWQILSGFAHVRDGSDIDLWVSVSDWAQADAAAARLQAVSGELPRVDGELMFDDGAAVAWREWLAWRSGKVKSLLVKSIAGSSLERTWGRQGAVALAEAA